MIDGLTGAKGKYLRFAHNDYDHLERLIKSNLDKYDNILVVTEAVFSMDGDRADIKKLCELKKQYSNVYLYVDEAHSFSVFAQNGAGLCASLGLADEIDFILVTFLQSYHVWVKLPNHTCHHGVCAHIVDTYAKFGYA